MPDYTVSWHAWGITTITADSEEDVRKKVRAMGVPKLCEGDDDVVLSIGGIDEEYTIPPEARGE